MPSVGIPGWEDDPWVVTKWSFRRLMERALEDVVGEDDIYMLNQAMALDGLHFDLLTPEENRRLVPAIRDAADDVRRRLLTSTESGQFELSVADAMDELIPRLDEYWQTLVQADGDDE